MLNYVRQFFISKTDTLAPNFYFAFLTQVTHYLTVVKKI